MRRPPKDRSELAPERLALRSVRPQRTWRRARAPCARVACASRLSRSPYLSDRSAREEIRPPLRLRATATGRSRALLREGRVPGMGRRRRSRARKSFRTTSSVPPSMSGSRALGSPSLSPRRSPVGLGGTGEMLDRDRNGLGSHWSLKPAWRATSQPRSPVSAWVRSGRSSESSSVGTARK